MATPIPANQATFHRDEVVSATGGTSGGPTWESASGVVTDSRAIQPGNLFVALRGERFDAHARSLPVADAVEFIKPYVCASFVGCPGQPNLGCVSIHGN